MDVSSVPVCDQLAVILDRNGDFGALLRHEGPVEVVELESSQQVVGEFPISMDEYPVVQVVHEELQPMTISLTYSVEHVTDEEVGISGLLLRHLHRNLARRGVEDR